MPLDVTFFEEPQGARGEVAAAAEVPVEAGPAKDEITLKIEALTALKRDPKTGKTNEKDSPYWSKEHPEHSATVEEVQRLYAMQEAKREAEQPQETDSEGLPISETAVPGVPEEIQVEAREILRGLGAPDEYITGLVKDYSSLGHRVYSSEDAITEINTRWGNEAAARLDDALLVVDEGGPDLAKFMNRHPEVGNNPEVIAWLSERGREIREARAAIEAIQDDATHPYHDSGHPRHAKSLDEMRRLFEIAHPGGARQ